MIASPAIIMLLVVFRPSSVCLVVDLEPGFNRCPTNARFNDSNNNNKGQENNIRKTRLVLVVLN